MRLTHVAMSVPLGSLTDDHCRQVVAFYGGLFGWREITSLRRSDRLSLSISRSQYVNIRERADAIVYSGYEHFGVDVGGAERVHELWSQLHARSDDVSLKDVTTWSDGSCQFRFRHLLPMAIEVQYLPGLADG